MSNISCIKLSLSIITILLLVVQGTLGQDIESIFGDKIEKYFSFPAQERETLMELGRHISIDEIDEDRIYAYANKRGFADFMTFDIDYEILRHPGDLDYEPKMVDKIDLREIQEWDFYPTYEGYIEMMDQFRADYPDICQVFSVGETMGVRDIMVARISDNVGADEKEPQFLYTSTMHGDETAGYVLMLRLIDYLLSEYGTNPRITYMIDNMDIWINPLANPDGTYQAGNHTVNGAIRGNNNGVDINRNFPDPEDGPHPDGFPWQTETIVFMDLAEDNRFTQSSNIHGGQEVCNYPWDTWQRFHVDTEWWEDVCHEYADTAHEYSPSGYMIFQDNGVTNGYAWYSVSGGRQDYMNYYHQCREFTLEISNQKLLSPGLLPAFWDYNYRSLLNYMEQAIFGISGSVKDSISGFPVEAEIFVISHDKVEDSSMVYSHLPTGFYSRLIEEGSHYLRISADGYYTKLVPNVSVTNRQETDLDVVLIPEGVGGVDNNQISSGISIYPNPVSGNSVKVNSEVEIKVIKLYNASGQLIDRIRVYNNGTSIDVTKLNPGLYFLDFNTMEGRGAKTLLVR